MWLYWQLFLVGLRLLGRERQDLVLENIVLRQQLAIHERRGHRAKLEAADRRFWSVTARGWVRWRSHLRIVQPAIVVGWHRSAWRSYWRRKSRGRALGRPRIDAETRLLITRLVTENPTWGVRRIADELKTLGISVGSVTVHRYLQRARRPSPSWRTFLRLHARHIWACDFFSVQTLSFGTFYVFLVIGQERRQIEHWNVTRHPSAQWVWRQVIAATPWGQQPRQDLELVPQGDVLEREFASFPSHRPQRSERISEDQQHRRLPPVGERRLLKRSGQSGGGSNNGTAQRH